MEQTRKDFFISYTRADQQQAEWIARILKEADYTVIIQAWDFYAGGNFVLQMQKALENTERTIAVLSPKYLDSVYARPEWAATFAKDPTGEKGLLIPVRIEKCELRGLLNAIIYIDLVNLSDEAAKNTLLQKIQQTIGFSITSTPQTTRYRGTLPPVWNIPRRNPNFTGRDTLLAKLRESLTREHHTALTQQAIYGLGGIGKTQLAIEYTYLNSSSYEYAWWIRAEESSTLVADYTALATALNLPEKNAAEQEKVVQAVRNWLDHHTGWLLVFDNARDAESIRTYLPQSSASHVLITSRNQNWRELCLPFEITVWSREESIAFLQKRTGKTHDVAADAIAEALGDLPLALEQAAAYIDSKQKSYAGYLELFKNRRTELWKTEKQPDNYPNTIATTWSLAFDEIRDIPFAQELLALASLAAPDAIPIPLLQQALEHDAQSQGAAEAIDELAIDDAIAKLSTYSLITVESEQNQLSLHRLVQAVVKDRMVEDELIRYRQALIKALSEQFPDGGYRNPDCWPTCATLLPHAKVILTDKSLDHDASWIERWLLLFNMACYKHGRAEYAEAEPLYHRALEIREQKLGKDHPDVATSLNNLGILLKDQGKYDEAEPLYRQALKIREQELSNDHPDVATSLNNLAVLLKTQGKYDEAEPLYRRALAIREQKLSNDHPDVATSLNNLGGWLSDQGKYDEAEPLYRQALAIREQKLGNDHPDVATSLNNLGLLLKTQGKDAEAEPLYRRALAIKEQKLGNDHPDVATSLNNLGLLLKTQGKDAEAEPLYRRALAIREQKLGKDHPDVATSLNNLGILLKDQGKYDEAEPLYRQALKIREQELSNDHPDVATSLNNLAVLLKTQGKYDEAEPLYRRALAIREQKLSNDHPDVATSLNNLGGWLSDQGKYDEAEPLYRRALAIREQKLGNDHPKTIRSRNNLNNLLTKM